MAKLDTGLVALGLGAVAILALRKDIGTIIKPVAGVLDTAQRTIALPTKVVEAGVQAFPGIVKTRKLKAETRKVIAQGERQILVADIPTSVTRTLLSKGQPRRALASERVTQLRTGGVLPPAKFSLGAAPTKSIKASKFRKGLKTVATIIAPAPVIAVPIIRKQAIKLKKKIFGKHLFRRG